MTATPEPVEATSTAPAPTTVRRPKYTDQPYSGPAAPTVYAKLRLQDVTPEVLHGAARIIEDTQSYRADLLIDVDYDGFLVIWTPGTDPV